MSKFNEKFDKFISAVSRLEEAIGNYENVRLDFVREGFNNQIKIITNKNLPAMRVDF